MFFLISCTGCLRVGTFFSSYCLPQWVGIENGEGIRPLSGTVNKWEVISWPPACRWYHAQVGCWWFDRPLVAGTEVFLARCLTLSFKPGYMTCYGQIVRDCLLWCFPCHFLRTNLMAAISTLMYFFKTLFENCYCRGATMRIVLKKIHAKHQANPSFKNLP